MFINSIRNNDPKENEYQNTVLHSKQKRVYRVVLPRQITDIKFAPELKTSSTSTETAHDSDYRITLCLSPPFV